MTPEQRKKRHAQYVHALGKVTPGGYPCDELISVYSGTLRPMPQHVKAFILSQRQPKCSDVRDKTRREAERGIARDDARDKHQSAPGKRDALFRRRGT